jgi:uncharacterized protein with HEPN domain
MKKDPKIYIYDVLESIRIIHDHLAGMSKIEFINSLKTQDAVIRRISIIGEAVNRIPDDYKDSYPEIP